MANPMANKVPVCPLCSAFTSKPSVVNHFWSDNRRDYYRCEYCHLVFVPSWQHLSPESEKAHYDLHQNDPHDKGYLQFLSRVTVPLLEKIPPNCNGLDFGAGPGPTLSVMLSEAGHSMAIYDPFYADNPDVLDNSYHFITATEVVEHLFLPGQVLQQLWGMLDSGGWLALMTKQVIDLEAFKRWHYKNDPTHVCFFSQATFAFLADQWSTTVESPAKDVVLMQKPLL